MGNSSSSSSRNDSQNPHQNPHQAPAMAPPPAGYYPSPSPYGNPTPYLPFSPYPTQYPYPTAPIPTTYYPGYSGAPWMPQRVPSNPIPRVPIPSIPEPQTTVKIKNEVNVKRSTVDFEEDPENPGEFLLSFTFDASTPGCIEVYYLVKEDENCSLLPLSPDVYKPTKTLFQKGYSQHFKQTPGTGLKLSRFIHPGFFFDRKEDEFHPLVIRLLSEPHSLIEGGETLDPRVFGPEPLPWGFMVPSQVQGQITLGTVEWIGEGKGGKIRAKVQKQKIWFQGQKYELQEIYGLEQPKTPSESEDADSTDFGKDCVICLSSPRDTAALPCRHMCMCRECAKIMRYQDNRCPICRQVVERLLEIRISPANQSETSGPSSSSVVEGGGEIAEEGKGGGKDEGKEEEKLVPLGIM